MAAAPKRMTKQFQFKSLCVLKQAMQYFTFYKLLMGQPDYPLHDKDST